MIRNHTVGVRIETRENGSPRGCADGRCAESIFEEHSIRGQPIDVRSRDVLAARASKCVIPLFIRHNEKHVRARCHFNCELMWMSSRNRGTRYGMRKGGKMGQVVYL